MASSQLESSQLVIEMPPSDQESSVQIDRNGSEEVVNQTKVGDECTLQSDCSVGGEIQNIGDEEGIIQSKVVDSGEVTTKECRDKSEKNGHKVTSSNHGASSHVGKKFKGVKVCCGDLRQYLYNTEIYRQASMLRKGREVHKVYVDVRKGSSFLEDRFSLTEFGRVVLQDGCVRAGRARNVRHIVVARETLYCSGTGGCRRACGGYGVCLAGCDKVKVRGHKCSFRVKLTMRLGFVDFWFVEIMGSHNCYIMTEREARGRGSANYGLDTTPSPPPSDMDKMLADYEFKSSDGEDSETTGGLSQGLPSAEGSPLMMDQLSNSVMAAVGPAGMMNLLQPLSIEGKKLLPATPTSPPTATTSSALSSSGSLLPSSSSSILFSPSAPCPLNVPLFSESYIMAMARNAAAAAAISECGMASPMASSPLLNLPSSPSRSSLPALSNGVDLIGGGAAGGGGAGSTLFPSGLLPPPSMIIPRFGFIPPLPLVDDSKHSLLPTIDDRVIDLSTPKLTKHEETEDWVSPQDLSYKKKRDINGHTTSSPKKVATSVTNYPASVYPRDSHIYIPPGQASAKYVVSTTTSSSGAVAANGLPKQTSVKSNGSDLVPSSRPQQLNGKARGSPAKRPRKNPPSCSLSTSSLSKDVGSASISKVNNCIPSFLPKQNELTAPSPSSALLQGFHSTQPSPALSSNCAPVLGSNVVTAAGVKSDKTQHSIDTANINSRDSPSTPSVSARQASSDTQARNQLCKLEEVLGDKSESSSFLTLRGLVGKSNIQLDKDLAKRVKQLEAHVTQLRNLVIKADGSKVEGQGRRKPQREFDFNKYNTRHVALKIAYLGWNYQGFVVQEDTDNTVEAVLFEALLRTKLIESRETSNYHRCGRTDKGVSALGQVISIDLRSNLLSGIGVKERPGGTASSRPGEHSTEIRYAHILNKVLPPEIRVLAWAPVNTNFSARFDCKKRTYKYYFPKGNLDLEMMKAAAQKLVGEHDFRNFCKMDVGNGVTNYMRKIFKTDITVLDNEPNGYSMCELTVVGQAFLWHQIRCIVAVLFLIGQGKEDAGVIESLLNVEENPRKPQYTMASELPLVLCDCEYGDDIDWVYEADWHEDNIRHFQQMWAQHTIKSTMLKRMLGQLDVAKVETESDIAPWNELSAPVLQQTDWIIPGNKPRIYKPLFKRQLCESLEERIEYYAKRSKLTVEKESKDEDGAGVSISSSPPPPPQASAASAPPK